MRDLPTENPSHPTFTGSRFNDLIRVVYATGLIFCRALVSLVQRGLSGAVTCTADRVQMQLFKSTHPSGQSLPVAEDFLLVAALRLLPDRVPILLD